MNWLQRLRVLTEREQTTRELDEELRFHLNRQIEENIAAGMTARQARDAALREFGGIESLKDECRTSRGLDWLDHLLQDIRYACRTFLRNPAFGVAVIALTAVGIGAATAVFSVVDRALFRPLPYRDAGRIAALGLRIPWLEYDFLTAGSYLELRRNPAPLEAVASFAGSADCDITEGEPLRLACAYAEASLLPLLGVGPALGRNFTAAEDQPGAPPVALLSHDFWKNRFGGRREAVGRRVSIDGRPVLIIGVLASGFELPTLQRADLVMPQALPPHPQPGARPLRIYGRLRPGSSLEQVRDAMLARAETLFSEIPPPMRKQVQFHVRGLRDVQTGDFQAASWTLLAAVFAVLLIACANAANLLLARSVARRQELAIRVALGAGRSRMVRQILTETLMLSLAGGAAGCVLAAALLRAFVLVAPDGIPRLASASLDARVLAAALAVSILCGIVFGLAGALHMPRPELLRARGPGPASLVARRLLVGAQIAVSLVLLTCAGVLLESLWQRQSLSLGIRTDRVVTAQLVLGPRYSQASRRGAFYEQLESRLAALPGVQSVALSDTLPPGGVPRSQPVFAPRVEGKTPFAEGTPGIVVWRAVTPEYFRTLEIPIVRGRAFTEQDRGPAERPIILSASYARRLFGDEDPIGRRMCRFPAGARNPAPWYTIVGVAADARNAGLEDRTDYEYYLVRRRGAPSIDDAPSNSAVIMRGPASPAAMQAWLRTEIAALDPVLPASIQTFERHIAGLAARPRFQAWLLMLFAAIGLLLAAFGLYGLVSFLVVQREREFGVRLTLGATPAGIVRLVMGDTVRWTAGGLLVGLIGAAAAARALRGLLFHVSPADPAAYAASALLLFAIALLAAFLPSRHAAQLDPARTLRQE